MKSICIVIHELLLRKDMCKEEERGMQKCPVMFKCVFVAKSKQNLSC